MPTPFDAFGYSEAQQTVNRAATLTNLNGFAVSPIVGRGVADSSARHVPVSSSMSIIRRMLDGDHWLDGLGWIGPRPKATDEGAAETMELLREGFVSQNALAEVIDRHVAGVVGKEPHWSFSPRRGLKPDEDPTEEEANLINEVEGFVTEWWDLRKMHKVLQELTRTLLYARRAPARLFVPRGKLTSANLTDASGVVRTVKVVNAADIPDGLKKIYPEGPLPEKAAVVIDPDTREYLGVVLATVGQNVIGTGAPVEIAELTYLAEPNAGGDAVTIIRHANQGGLAPGGQKSGAIARLDFGGRIAMFEMSRSAFITPQMVQLQRALNLAMTALPRNVITGGWLERVITNAQMPGRFVADPTKPNGKRWVSDRHITGAGTTTYLKGLKNVDQATGAEAYAAPSVSWRPPSDVHPTVESQDSLYSAILREAKQEHALMAQSEKPSGKSREQARADFEMTLEPTASEVNGLGRWLLETVVAMAEAFAGTPGKYTDELRAVFECVIDSGPITAQERTAIDASVSSGTLSRESAMAREGVQDVTAEIARIRRDPAAELDAIAKRAAAWAVLVGQGADIEGAAIAVGFDADAAAELVPELSEPPDPNDTNDPADNNPPPSNEPPAPAPKPAPTPKNPPTPVPAGRMSRRQRQRAKGNGASGNGA